MSRARAALEAAGHDVRLLTSSIGSAGDGTSEYVARGSDNLLAKVVLQVANPFAVASAKAAVADFGPDVVLVNMVEQYLSPTVFRAVRDVPTVAFVHYYKPICPTALKVLPDGRLCGVPAGLVCWRTGCVGAAEWLRDRPRYALIRNGLSRARRVLACSRWVADELAANGIAAMPIALPVPSPGRRYTRAPADDPLFLYVGRLNLEKGVDVLLRAFASARAERPKLRLRVVGGGPRLAALRRFARALGVDDATEFLGHAPFHVVETHLSQAWTLVAPSVWPEPLGLVAIEAITHGVPVIASATGGLAETVEPGVGGSLVPNGDARALADALVAAADGGPASVPDRAVQALRERHSTARHAADLTNVFADAVRGADPTAVADV